MNKFFRTLVIITSLFSLVALSACGSGSVYLPPTSPEAMAQSDGNTSAVTHGNANVWDEPQLAALGTIREFALFAAGDISIKIIKDLDSAAAGDGLAMLGVYSKAVAISQADGPVCPIADVVAVVVILGITYYIVLYNIEHMPAPEISFTTARWTAIQSEAQSGMVSPEFTSISTISALESIEFFETAEAEYNQIFENMTTTATIPLSFPSMKHSESDRVKSALYSLVGSGYLLQQRGDCRSSGSLCMWAGANFANMTGSIMISFVACTRVAYAVLTAPLIFNPVAELILTGKLVKVAENAYIDPTVATWTAAFLLGVGGTTGKGYNPSEAITFGQGWASLEYKREQYGIKLVVAEIHLPTP